MLDLVRELGLQPWVMTSGSRGYHVTVPLRRGVDFDATRAFARDVAALASRREPRLFTTEQRKAKREGRILIDVMRNAYAHSAVAPYAVRARPGAPVAAPLHPDELADSQMRPDRWTLRTLPLRLERDGDPWEGIGGGGQAIGAARQRLQGAMEEL
jgi:bifunctional non-homologous end joining protein LigD